MCSAATASMRGSVRLRSARVLPPRNEQALSTLSAGRAAVLVLIATAWPTVANAQQPFSTDDADVTPRGTTHVEVFNEHDWLQSGQRPHLRQNTLNMRVNYGLTNRLELDLDAPLIAIFNASPSTPQRPFGVGDTNFGL